MSSAGTPVICATRSGGYSASALGQLVEADGVVAHVGLVHEPVADDDVRHPEGERGVGPGRIAMCQSARLAVRVRSGSITTTFAPRLRASATNGHMCDVRAHQVAGPDDDVPRVHEALGVDARRRPDRHEVGRRRAGVAERPLAHARAEAVEERVADGEAVEHPERAEVAVRQDRLASRARRDRREALGDLVERGVPGDRARSGPRPSARRAAAGAGSRSGLLTRCS